MFLFPAVLLVIFAVVSVLLGQVISERAVFVVVPVVIVPVIPIVNAHLHGSFLGIRPGDNHNWSGDCGGH
jgi:hypothetical protein